MVSVSALFIQCIVVLIANVIAGPQSVQYDVTITGNIIVFDMTIFQNDGQVNAVEVIDETTGLAGCAFTTGDGSLTAVAVSGDDARRISFTIDDSGILTETVSGDTCPLKTINAVNNEFVFYLRSLNMSGEIDAANDREFDIIVSGANRTNVNKQGKTSANFVGPVLPTKTTVTPTDVTTDLLLINGGASVSSLDLGLPAQLRVQIVIDPYVEYLDIVGARITDCYVDDTGAFDNHNLNFIGTNGCWLQTDMYDNMHLDKGFNFDSATEATGALTFMATTPRFEMSAFANALNSPDTLHFKCSIEYCFSSSDTCHSEHCVTTVMKKRSIQKPDLKVTTSVNITRKNNDACDKCSESVPFIVSTASIGSLVAIVCGLMSCTFIGAVRAGKSSLVKQQRQLSDYCRTTVSNLSSKSDTFSRSSRTSGSMRKY